MALTWLLIALLNVSVSGTLFGWVFESHVADCHRRSAQFMQKMMEHGTQGPVQECER